MQVKPKHVSDIIYSKMREYSYFVGGKAGDQYLRVTERSSNQVQIKCSLGEDVTEEQVEDLGNLFIRILAMLDLNIPVASVDGALHDAAHKNVEIEK